MRNSNKNPKPTRETKNRDARKTEASDTATVNMKHACFLDR